jgi:hypothetical protein
VVGITGGKCAWVNRFLRREIAVFSGRNAEGFSETLEAVPTTHRY